MSIYALGSEGNDLFAGTDGGNVFLSTNNGTSWTKKSNSKTLSPIISLAVHVNASGGNVLFAGTNSGAFRSTDSGTTWSVLSSYIVPQSFNALLFAGNSLFAGTTGRGALMTTENANHWTEVNSGFPQATSVNALALSGTILFAGTADFGVRKRSITEMATFVQSPPANTPVTIALEQNYPNPFNPTTNFEFRIANFEFVTLKIFDVLGREVARLVDGEKYPGSYEIRWEAGSLPSGIYFYQLRAGEFLERKKMMLPK